MEMLTKEQILEKLTGNWAGKSVLVLEETDSTNIQCANLVLRKAGRRVHCSGGTPMGWKRKTGTELGVTVWNRNMDESAAASGYSS